MPEDLTPDFDFQPTPASALTITLTTREEPWVIKVGDLVLTVKVVRGSTQTKPQPPEAEGMVP